MEFIINNLPLKAELKNNTYYFLAKHVFFIYTGSINKSNNIELRKVSKQNYIKGEIGGNGALINGEGIKEWLQNTLLKKLNRKECIYELWKHGLIKSYEYVYTRKEIEFFLNLKSFCEVLKIDIKSQVNIDKYIVDFCIGNIIIEFDENEHKNYNKTNELEREIIIKNNGYKILRINDKNNIGYNLAEILNIIQNDI